MVKNNLERDWSPADAGEAPKGAEEAGRTVDVVVSYSETVSKDYQSKNFFCSLKETVPLRKFDATFQENYQRCMEKVDELVKGAKTAVTLPQIEEYEEIPKEKKPF